MVAQLHSSCKILEHSLEPACASHPNQLLLFSLNLQRGIELPDHCLIPILPELKNPPQAHASEKVNQAAHRREDLQLQPTQPLLFYMHRPDVNTPTVQPELITGVEE